MVSNHIQRLLYLGAVAGFLASAPFPSLAAIPLLYVYMSARLEDYAIPTIVALFISLILSKVFLSVVLHVFLPTFFVGVLFVYRHKNKYLGMRDIVDVFPMISFICVMLLNAVYMLHMESCDIYYLLSASRISAGIYSATLAMRHTLMMVSIFVGMLCMIPYSARMNIVVEKGDPMFACLSFCVAICFSMPLSNIMMLFLLVWRMSKIFNIRNNKNVYIVIAALAFLQGAMPASGFAIIMMIVPFMRGLLVMNERLNISNKYVRFLVIFALSFCATIVGVFDAVLDLRASRD